MESKRRKARREVLRALKAERGCELCGEDDPCCLDFHHLDPDEKIGSVANLISEGATLAFVLEEVEKCVVLCSNCHRKEHN